MDSPNGNNPFGMLPDYVDPEGFTIYTGKTHRIDPETGEWYDDGIPNYIERCIGWEGLDGKPIGAKLLIPFEDDDTKLLLQYIDQSLEAMYTEWKKEQDGDNDQGT